MIISQLCSDTHTPYPRSEWREHILAYLERCTRHPFWLEEFALEPLFQFALHATSWTPEQWDEVLAILDTVGWVPDLEALQGDRGWTWIKRR